MTAWDKVKIARDSNRKTSLEYIDEIFDDFIELHGDRISKDDKAIVCGLGKIDDMNFTIIAEQKGRNTKENIERNFGMPNPESYRKAIRFIKQSNKFKRPVITFIDTKGAFPGVEAEERGQGEAIAESMMEMAKLEVPSISIVIGEGSSGGALAIGVTNKIYMLENAIYSILSPEGYSSILWKDSSRVQEAAEKMKLTADDLYKMKIIDKIIPENFENENIEPKLFDQVCLKKDSLQEDNLKKEFLEKKSSSTALIIRNSIIDAINMYSKMSGDDIKEDRYMKFRKIEGFIRR